MTGKGSKGELPMQIKLFDSELKVMEVLWDEGDLSAGELAKRLAASTGWNRNTTYTVIKKCIEKGAIQRHDPGFICHALITREQAQTRETAELIHKLFDGSVDRFFSAFVGGGELSTDKIDSLRRLIDEME